MVTCPVSGCKSNTKKASNKNNSSDTSESSATGATSPNGNNSKKVHFFTVPSRPEIIKQWQEAINRPDFVMKKGTRVCSKHFHEEK